MNKKIIAALMLTVLFTAVCACQPTPEAPIVQSKGDGALQDVIAATAMPKGKYAAPEVWKESFSGTGTVYTARIDAKVTVPDSDVFPVYRVYPEEFTQERLDAFLSYFVSDAPLYEVADVRQRTKGEILVDVLAWQNKLDALTNPNHEDYQSYVDEYGLEEMKNSLIPECEETLSAYRQAYVNAPEKRTMTPVERKMKESANYEKDWEILRAYTEDMSISIGAQNYTKPRDISQSRYARFFERGAYYISNSAAATGGAVDFHDAKYTYEQALQIARQTLSDLGSGSYTLALSYTYHNTYELYMEDAKQYDPDQRFYSFYFTPTLPGNAALPMLLYPLASDFTLAVSMPWDPHSIDIHVNADSGLAAYGERSSIRFADVLNSNVELLPFDQIQNIARRYLVLSPYLVTPNSHEEGEYPINIFINVNDIQLGYIKISEKDNISAGLCVPVWMFYGNQTDEYESAEKSAFKLDENNMITYPCGLRTPMLCINAIDGSIIDLTLGY